MKLPRDPEELLPALFAFGVSIGLAKLLASSMILTWRSVIGRALESGALAMCAGIALLLPAVIPGLSSVPPIVLLGVGGLLASLGVSGLLKLIRAVRGAK
jgi:hypothetical protein